jgi:uncharacterized protein (DUF488 family)
VEVFTIGFTKKSAERFFQLLSEAEVGTLIDVRLNNASQLAGFTKRDDLAFFVRELCHSEYVHEPLLAPEAGMLDAYKKQRGSWSTYEASFLQLMAERRIEERLPRSFFANRPVLLCSEPTPERCHRRLVVEYLQDKWGDIEVVNL